MTSWPWKKCQDFGNFLTVKWQFSGGSAGHSWLYIDKLSRFVMWWLLSTQWLCCWLTTWWLDGEVLSDLATKKVRFAPKETNPGLFQIRFHFILAPWKSPGLSFLVPIWPTLCPKLTNPWWRDMFVTVMHGVRWEQERQVWPKIRPDRHQIGQN